MLGEVTVTAEASNNNPYPPIIDKNDDPFRSDDHQVGEDPNYLGGPSGQGGNHGESTLLEYAGVGGYVSHGVGKTAEMTGEITYKYGTATKSAAQLTREGAELMGKIAKPFNIAGATIGAGVNGYKAYENFSSGHYGMGAYNTTLSASYATGMGILIFGGPAAPIGAGILLITGGVDLAGEIIINLSTDKTGH
jgi:hypothetical protein